MKLSSAPLILGLAVLSGLLLASVPAKYIVLGDDGCEPLSSEAGKTGSATGCTSVNVWATSESAGTCPDEGCTFSSFQSTTDSCDTTQVEWLEVGTQVKAAPPSGTVTNSWNHGPITPDCGSAGPNGKAKYITLLLLDGNLTQTGSYKRKFVCTACEE